MRGAVLRGRRAMAVAAELCVFTNDRVTVETIG